jgi:diaminopimelate epimerase
VDALPGDAQFYDLSPRIERHPFFPERTSVLWTRIDGPHHLQLRIWERGAGETLGCGTGACAAAVLARAQNRLRGTTGEVEVASKGGVLRVGWCGGDTDEIFLTGPAQIVFRGHLRLSAP